MIFVTLGTQDKQFTRLLTAIENEILNNTIKEDVIVQAGYTKYKTDNMKIIDMIPIDEFDNYIKSADLIITHGGVGSIITGLKNNKKVIAASRLAKYKEHVNDHQKQIVENFSKAGYILALNDEMNNLAELLKESKHFKPNKYKSNTLNMIKLVKDEIGKE